MTQKIIILTPVFNDGESFNQLQVHIQQVLGSVQEIKFSYLIVNDGSTELLGVTDTGTDITILNLQRNLGHQKALAIGLAYIHHQLACDKVIVMDCDGEDRPHDIPVMLHASDIAPTKIIAGFRKSRQEGTRFRIFYKIFQQLFAMLTGKKIAFGNFMVIPRPLLDRLVYYSEIWSHLPGGIIRSGLPFSSVPTHRGKRYAGQSKMNFTSLLMHGLGAIAVFIDVIATRLLMISIFLIVVSFIAILVIIGIRTFTDYAIPGWASTLVSSLLIVLLQAFLLSLFTMLLFLVNQSQRRFIPARHFEDYLGFVEKNKNE